MFHTKSCDNLAWFFLIMLKLQVYWKRNRTATSTHPPSPNSHHHPLEIQSISSSSMALNNSVGAITWRGMARRKGMARLGGGFLKVNCLGCANGDLISPHKPERPQWTLLFSKCAWAHYAHYNSSAPQLYLTRLSSTVGMRPQPILFDQMGWDSLSTPILFCNTD